MGTGKTTVGRLLAERLERPLVDSDAEIEAETGRTVREIFATDGEEAFRALETASLRRALTSDEPSVIAAAGGVVLSPINREALKAADARVVWLQADTEVLAERVRNGGHRPLLDDDPAGTLRRMADDRERLYREVADDVVCVAGRTPEQVAEDILQ